ncbi:MAG: DUF2304 domain-containing protein [Micromonosporaceae bacterium]
MAIQVLLLLAVALLLVGFVRAQNGVRMQAGKRLAFFGFLALNVWTVLRPGDLTWLAQSVGVGRGADLLLYALVIAFVFTVLNFYLRLRDLSERFTALARSAALRDAELLNRRRGVLADPPSALLPTEPDTPSGSAAALARAEPVAAVTEPSGAASEQLAWSVPTDQRSQAHTG